MGPAATSSSAPLPQDEFFTRQALALASETVALASPNPQVGCVLVRDGQVIGEGAHRYEDRDHAEIVALKQASARGVSTTGATAYVTLEPCAHHGRTGPCADALIAAGIARVVAATWDPNPLVAGQGIDRLRAAGVEVTTGVLEGAARAMNDAFAHFIQHGMPFVTLKAALSAEGYLAPSPATRVEQRPYWLTGPESRAEVQRLRHASDAVLTGIGTVLADDPLLTDRTGRPRRRPLLRIVLDAGLRIPLDSRLVSTANNDLLIVTTDAAEEGELKKKMGALRDRGAEVLSVHGEAGRPSIAEVLKQLAKREILSVLLECGAALNGAFLRGGFVDKAILFCAPVKLSEGAIPFAEGIESPQAIERSLEHATHSMYGADTCITGYLHDPWGKPSP